MHRPSELLAPDLALQTLPRPNRKLTELAQEVVRCAQPLLPQAAGLFLGLQRDADDTLRLIWWRRDDFRLIAEIAVSTEGFCPEDTAEGAMQDAASALLAYLAGRWPATPIQFGVITDGIGVAFAPEHPAPASQGWLLRHASGAASLTAILPLDPEGPCALLCGSGRPLSLH
ncbi:hypothetical protein [Sphingomonas sp. dw_22]|uniref:hypothetical protein n=1 Tax=Sphingomonas sp. dw_22 TaxID=2721175 RepID=UPI001BD569EC|nr:hypothetical protein [Sphingomonas sp. dw_22]